MTQLLKFDIKEFILSIEHFHPHYLDENGLDSPQLVEAINEIINELPNYCNLSGGYVWIDDRIDFKTNYCIQINDKFFDAGKVVYNMLKKSEQLCLFICTAGKSIIEWSRSLFADGDFLKGYLVDMAGSILVDMVADKIEKQIESEASKSGMFITNRYSPGYCNWNVSEQQHLFSFFPENFCGISLTSSSLMIPEKSISGIIGIGKKVKKVPYTCSMCEMENCMYSKTKKAAVD